MKAVGVRVLAKIVVVDARGVATGICCGGELKVLPHIPYPVASALLPDGAPLYQLRVGGIVEGAVQRDKEGGFYLYESVDRRPSEDEWAAQEARNPDW